MIVRLPFANCLFDATKNAASGQMKASKNFIFLLWAQHSEIHTFGIQTRILSLYDRFTSVFR
jgi:hypothetical protein